MPPASSKALHGALDDRFEKLLEDVQFNVVETDLTPEKRRERRALADGDDLEFCRIYFGRIFDAPFNRLHRHVADLKTGKHSVSGHRRSGKSAFTYVAKLLKPMCLGNGGLLGIGLRTQEKAVARGEGLVRLLKANRLLAYDYELSFDQERAGHWIVNNTHLIATSYSVGLRAYVDDDFKRFRVFITDDLYDRTTVTSELDNGRVVEFITSEVWGQLEDGALNINNGNSITETCPIERLKELFPANHFEFPALDEHGESNWPERFPTAYWVAFQAETPGEVWMGDYQCRPALRGEYFEPEWIRHAPLVNVLDVVATVSVLDPSYGQSPEACYKALLTGSLLSNDRVHVEDVYLRREGYDRLFDYVYELRLAYPKWKALLFENDFSQWAFAAPYYAQWCEARSLVLPVQTHSAKGLKQADFGADKESRIISLVHPLQTGRVDFDPRVKGTKDFERLRIQLLSVGRSKEKLDGPDALATLWIMIRRYKQTGGFKALKPRVLTRPAWLGGFR